MKKITRSLHINVSGITEQILNKNSYKSNFDLKNETIAIIGYGPQGRNQSLNLRDNKQNVIVGLRKGKSWDKALKDGWEDGKTLFEIDEATNKGTIIQYLLSDASQIKMWDTVKSNLSSTNALCFSHGFGIVYNDQTKIIPPDNIDVFLVAPKGPGSMLRKRFLEESGVNSSYAIHQDYSCIAEQRCISLAFAIGSLNLFKTTFYNEVTSDLTGERCVLMGMIQGAFKAQYDVLRENGHSPSESFNETIAETEHLYALIHQKGMDWMFANCSSTAQRGALDWSNKFYNVIRPSIEECYNSVKSGEEAKRSIESNSDPKYKEKLDRELKEISDQEMWQVAKQMREIEK
jgi:ketol-acid reductoisomerase